MLVVVAVVTADAVVTIVGRNFWPTLRLTDEPLHPNIR